MFTEISAKPLNPQTLKSRNLLSSQYMDQAKADQKIRAMKYLLDNMKSHEVLYNLIFSSLVALVCRVLCSYSFGLSPLSVFLNPKCSFIMFNVIVAFLVSESKLLGSRKSSPTNDLYSEYVERAQSLRGQKGNSSSIVLDEAKSEVNDVCEDKEIVLREHEEEDEEEREEEDGGEEFEDRTGDGDELNRRVEDFIARINKQRWVEARMLVCGKYNDHKLDY